MSNAPPNPLPGVPYAVTQLVNGSVDVQLMNGHQLRKVQLLVSLYGFAPTAAGYQQCATVLAWIRRRAREIDRLGGYTRITECVAADESPVQRDLTTNQHFASVRLVLTYVQT